jgi:hypothetical protein
LKVCLELAAEFRLLYFMENDDADA